MYLCVLCGSENKQRLFPYTALTDWFFITERECVSYAVRAQYLNTTHFNLRLSDCSIAPLASRRFLTLEVRVRFQASPCAICSEQSGTESGFSSSSSFFPPVSNIPQILHTHLRVVHYFAEKDKRSNTEKLSKSNSVSKI